MRIRRIVGGNTCRIKYKGTRRKFSSVADDGLFGHLFRPSKTASTGDYIRFARRHCTDSLKASAVRASLIGYSIYGIVLAWNGTLNLLVSSSGGGMG